MDGRNSKNQDTTVLVKQLRWNEEKQDFHLVAQHVPLPQIPSEWEKVPIAGGRRMRDLKVQLIGCTETQGRIRLEPRITEKLLRL